MSCVGLSSQFQRNGQQVCNENPRVFSLLQGYVDGEITIEELSEVEDHYNRCNVCKDRVLILRELKGYPVPNGD